MLLNFAARFIVCPFVVLLGQAIGAVRFLTGGQILATGLLLAALSIVMDLVVLPVVGNALATVIDFFASSAFLWIAGQVAMGALVTFTGAMTVGVMLAATEWAMHSWLGATRRRRRVR